MKNPTPFYIMIVCMFWNSLWGMTPQNDSEFLPKGTETTFSIFIKNAVDLNLLDHSTMCSLGLVNKQCDMYLTTTALQRKNLSTFDISQEILQKSLIVWHKYGSACGIMEEAKRILEFYCCFFNKWNKIRDYFFYNSQIKLGGFEKPFFDECGNVCCYVLEKKQLPLYLDRTGGMFKCCISTTSERSKKRLVVSIGDDLHYTLSKFLAFPVLLKAFLHADQFYKDNYCCCDLSKAIVPSDYKTYVPCEESFYKQFDDLPERLRTAIEDRYKQQFKK